MGRFTSNPQIGKSGTPKSEIRRPKSERRLKVEVQNRTPSRLPAVLFSLRHVEFQAHLSALTGGGLYVQRATDAFHTLAHVFQAVAPAGLQGGIEAAPIVLDNNN